MGMTDTFEAPKRDYISVSIASKRLCLGVRMVQKMCEGGVFRTAHKPGMGRNAHWKISSQEVNQHKYKSHPNPNFAL
jgi:hypothetical protein